MRIAAGIVLYNPKIERFRECLQIVEKQFEEIVIFDNVGDMKNCCRLSEGIIYITENQNKGIAYALNRIMERAKADGCEWVVTLDQDTVIPDNMLACFRKYVSFENVAIISPQVIDKRRKYMQLRDVKEDVIDVDFCITSASCTNLRVWELIGGFDEWLFIDFVDNDFCKRARLEGYRILQLQNLVIDQEFGKITLKSPSWVNFYLWLSKVTHNKNVAKLSYRKEVSPFRVYYVHRNLLYLNKKFKDSGGIGYKSYYCTRFVGFLFYFTLPSIVRGREKMKIFKAIIKGLYDGYKAEIH